MLKESKADIFVDPVLHTACALDIKHHCAAITPGRGRQMSCLMEALEDKRVRLQPECKKRLNDRIEMWSYAAKVRPGAPPEVAVSPVSSQSLQNASPVFLCGWREVWLRICQCSFKPPWLW
ncbi:golgi glycoprotein 1 [Phyllostomus discolor]|uniref:Golgi glycoprotein 1 n=1 Tax=Phyllostomus discolor TaxID=89673 RepID=A0A833YKX8_9CHIR|nr:golgi glycoprotein 1 [Phyllostomus discolor]